MLKTYRQIILTMLLCGMVNYAEAQITRSDTFNDQYTLKEVVVLSRHNIRSPLSGPESALGRMTPHEWYHWTSGKSELSLRYPSAILKNFRNKPPSTISKANSSIAINFPISPSPRGYIYDREKRLL